MRCHQTHLMKKLIILKNLFVYSSELYSESKTDYTILLLYHEDKPWLAFLPIFAIGDTKLHFRTGKLGHNFCYLFNLFFSFFFFVCVFTVDRDLGVWVWWPQVSSRKNTFKIDTDRMRKRDVNALSSPIAVFLSFLPIKNKRVLWNIIYYIYWWRFRDCQRICLGIRLIVFSGQSQSTTVFGNAYAFLCKTWTK